MKQQTLISVFSLILASSLDASQRAAEEHCFRPAFQKTLHHVKSVGWRSFQSKGRSQNLKKKVVFIDWRKLYWGKLSDLIYSEEETYMDDGEGVSVTEGRILSALDTQDSQAFAQELRQELKLFAKQYGLTIVWRKKSLDERDGTAAFLEYWDKGLSQEEGNTPTFAELCALSASEVTASTPQPVHFRKGA